MQKSIIKIVLGEKRKKKKCHIATKKRFKDTKVSFLKFLFTGGMHISYVSARCQINHPVAYQHFCWFDKLQVKGLTLHNVAKP